MLLRKTSGAFSTEAHTVQRAGYPKPSTTALVGSILVMRENFTLSWTASGPFFSRSTPHAC